MFVRLGRWGNSVGMRMPQAIVEHFALESGSEVRLRLQGASIVIEPVVSCGELEDLIAGISPGNARAESSWGRSSHLAAG